MISTGILETETYSLKFMGKLIREDSTDVASFYQTNADRILKDLEITYEVIKNWHEE